MLFATLPDHAQVELPSWGRSHHVRHGLVISSSDTTGRVVSLSTLEEVLEPDIDVRDISSPANGGSKRPCWMPAPVG
jgi:hypothetical protein